MAHLQCTQKNSLMFQTLAIYVYAWHTVTESFVYVSVCTCNSACVCVCVRVLCVCTFSGAFFSWSSKGALAKLKHTAKVRDIEEAIAKSDWSTARHLLREVFSGK